MTQKTEFPVFRIRLVFADDKMNGVTTIGGAGWTSKVEQEAAWAAIPEFPVGGESDFLADLLDEQGDIVADKPVTAETCEALMGKPIATLIEEGRRDTCYTFGDFKAKHPELCKPAVV